MSEQPYLLKDPADLVAHRISPGDTVRLAVIAGPADGLDHTVVFEIWDPGGSQPPNSHEASIETFHFLRGSGIAHSDGQQVPVSAGQLLVLPAGTTHRIEADGAEPLVAVTTMVPDAGFAAMIERGEVAPLSDDERRILSTAVVTP